MFITNGPSAPTRALRAMTRAAVAVAVAAAVVVAAGATAGIGAIARTDGAAIGIIAGKTSSTTLSN